MTTGTELVDSDILMQRLDLLTRHIENVREDCYVLGQKLINKGEADFGIQLIANGYIHDNSKFAGIEWLYLHEDIKGAQPDYFKLAAQQHITTNPHHPEFWQSIDVMPRIYVAEMVCDWHARSSEFGTDLREWIKDKACKKYTMSCSSKIYKQIKDFLDLLLERSFS